MNNGGDAAEQIVRLSLEGFEVAVRLTGSAAKNIAILLASVLKQEISQSNKTRGKARLTNMIKSGKELKVFSFQQKDLPKFTEQAKRYGVLYCVLRDKNTKSDTAMVDIIARAEDAAKIQRISDRFELGKVDKASIVSEAEKDVADREAAANEVPTKSRGEIIVEEAMGKPMQKEENSHQNPSVAKTDKSPLSERDLETTGTHTDKGVAKAADKKPSVKEKLDRYKGGCQSGKGSRAYCAGGFQREAENPGSQSADRSQAAEEIQEAEREVSEMDQLKEHPQIVELLGTLDKNGLMKEKSEVQSLVSYIGGMEETLTEMLGELQDMRREINLIHNNTLRSKCHTLVEKTEGKIRQGFSAVKKMKDNLIQSAGNAVRAFRERGRDALAESVRAMKIPEALDKLSAMFGRMSKEMAQDTKKLSAMQTELQGAKGHLKNMGLLFMGKAAKEAEHSKTDKGVLSRLSRLFEKAQKGFASLEQKAMDTADKLRVSRVKSSVKENLSRYRAAAKAEKGTERSEPTTSKEENRTVQALGQISAPHPQKSNLSKER